MQLRNSLVDKMQAMSKLPPLPGILRDVFEACKLEDSEAQKKIPQIIEKEPLLAEKILKLANSSCFEPVNKVDNISSAIALIGVRAIKNTAVIATMVDIYSESIRNTVFDLKLFWWHAVKCAVIARLIAKKEGYSQSYRAFVCGFLHDIGKLLLLLNLPEQHTQAESYSDQDAMFLASEMHFGITHSEVGAWLLDQWNLETFMVDAVLYHHEPQSRVMTALPLVRIVYVANMLSQASLQRQEEGLKTAKEIFGLSKLNLDELLKQSDNEIQEIAALLGAKIEGPGGSMQPVALSDLKKAEDLRRNLKAAGLLIRTLQSLMAASDQKAIFRQIRRGLKNMFKVEPGLIFLYDIERNTLVGKVVEKNGTFCESEDMWVPMQAEQSLLVKSLHQRKPLHSFRLPPESPHAITDEQIIRFVGKEGILCLPLTARGEYVGVIVIGLDKAELSRLSKHVDILTMLSNQAALPLHLDLLKEYRFQTLQRQQFSAVNLERRERRNDIRKRCSLSVRYATDEQAFTDFARDISVGGAFIETTSSLLTVGEQIRLIFTPPNQQKSVRVKGEVMWIRLSGAGVRFTEPSQCLRKMIASL